MRWALLLLVACSPQPSKSTPPAVEASTDAAPPPADVAPPPAPVAEAPSFDDLVPILFAERASAAPITAACPSSLPADARIRCLFDERFKGDPKAASLAHGLWTKLQIPTGVEAAHTMDGGYRGTIELRPAVPIHADRKHLEWVSAALYDFDLFFTELARGTTPSGPLYRFHPITLRFVRSINTNTPAAYAVDWTVTYNVAGSINVSADAVRETMFHEIFHLNDAAHGGWSHAALGTIFDGIVKKCGTTTACLTPYSPGDTMVRNGTYYSFQPGNGVGEYAAELALRYYREERAALRHLPKGKTFKCGPAENFIVWSRIRDEFFGGIDVTPPCP